MIATVTAPAALTPAQQAALDALHADAVADRLPPGPVITSPDWDADCGAGWHERNHILMEPCAVVIQCYAWVKGHGAHEAGYAANLGILRCLWRWRQGEKAKGDAR